MPEVPIRHGVRAGLKPQDDSVQLSKIISTCATHTVRSQYSTGIWVYLAESSDTGMMDVEVNHIRGNREVEGNIDEMKYGKYVPRRPSRLMLDTRHALN